MNIIGMKNMIVLKNLPSNLIEEAFVVLKENKNIHKYEIENVKRTKKEDNKQEKNDKQDKEYIVKEAEMLLKEYADNLEKKTPNIKKLEKKYKFSVKLNFVLLFTTALGGILCLL